jgi:hypothetical protein
LRCESLVQCPADSFFDCGKKRIITFVNGLPNLLKLLGCPGNLTNALSIRDTPLVFDDFGDMAGDEGCREYCYATP